MSYYNISETEEKILKVIANPKKLHPSIYGRTEDGKANLHIWTIDARTATKAVSKLLKVELRLLGNINKYENALNNKFPKRENDKYAEKIAYNQNDINQIVRQAIRNAFNEIKNEA